MSIDLRHRAPPIRKPPVNLNIEVASLNIEDGSLKRRGPRRSSSIIKSTRVPAERR